VRQQKKAEEVNAVVESQKLDVDIYQLRDRINDLFFGILLMKEQIAQSELMKNDLSSALKKVQASIQHGTALRSQGDILQAELLRIDQRIIELQSAEASFREILGMFTDHLVGNSTILAKPEWTMGSDSIRRPELNLFGLQKQGIEANRALLSARKKPRIELFLQGGYGRPALNMLENSFDLYYIGGIRFNWLLSGYYTFRRENEILDLRQQSLDVQKETFLFNTNLTRSQHDAEIAKLQRLIQADDEIIMLRMRVMETASVQLEEGVISANDYIREVNAADQAKQNRALHEAQRLIAQAKYRFTTGQ
jgi:outer membrane protein TolC